MSLSTYLSDHILDNNKKKLLNSDSHLKHEFNDKNIKKSQNHIC